MAEPAFMNERQQHASKQEAKRDLYKYSFDEMLAALQNILDRTGDLEVRAIITRANEARRTR